ncbi:MAG TPA: helix-turn-helix domain-containing protein, partial [Myxococcota bacterium]|nr:helix-turn-helix domain-containing protein [Myxococcota bacterium]
PADIELSLESFERACLEEALRRCEGDVRAAAKLLGIGRSTFYRKLERRGAGRSDGGPDRGAGGLA